MENDKRNNSQNKDNSHDANHMYGDVTTGMYE